jgi:LuxR family maltose regulon positive regulatory protein
MPAGTRKRAQEMSTVSGPLLEGRFTPPPARASLVPRRRLLEKIGAHDEPVVVLAAGPGYGKTTLLGQLQRAQDRPVAWLSLDRTDNDPTVLLSYLVAALALAVPVESRVFDTLSGRASARASAEALRHLTAAFSNAPAPFLLVLDDVHEVTEPEAVDVLVALWREVPRGSQVVIAGRSMASLPLARLRSQGLLLELGPADLAMDPDEAGALLRHTEVSLSQDEVSMLTERTEGWPAALYLAALAIRSGADRHEIVRSGRDRAIDDYLRTELIAHLDPHDAAFLAATAVLERLSGPLCDAVLERRDSRSRLAALAQTNLFVLPLDHRGHWYRCHPLVRELLLSERTSGDLAGRHRRASTWYEEEGDVDAAIEHAHRGGDLEAAARLVGAHGQPAIARGRDATARRWLSRFDDEALLRWPSLAIHGAWIHALRGEVAECLRFAELAEAGDEASEPLDGAASIASARAMLRSGMSRGGIGAMTSDALIAYELEPATSTWRPLAVTLFGVATSLGGDTQGAESLFAEATDAIGPTAGNPASSVAWAERATLARARGDLREADRSIERAREIVAERGLQGLATSALTLAVDARVGQQLGDLGRARSQIVAFHRLRPLLSGSLPWLAIQARIEAAHTLLGLADGSGAQTLLVEIDAIVRTNPDLGTFVEQIDDLRTQIGGQPAGTRGASTLTSAELRLLPLLPTHLSFPEIGERLFISRSTVKTQAISIYRKLGVSSRNEAVERAREVGLLPT